MTKGSTGYDLYSIENIEMITHSVNTISADVRFKIPKNYFPKIYPHSSYALKFTDVGAGVIHSITEEKFLLFSLTSLINFVK